MAPEEKYDQPLAPSRRLTLRSVKMYIEIKKMQMMVTAKLCVSPPF